MLLLEIKVDDGSRFDTGVGIDGINLAGDFRRNTLHLPV